MCIRDSGKVEEEDIAFTDGGGAFAADGAQPGSEGDVGWVAVEHEQFFRSEFGASFMSTSPPSRGVGFIASSGGGARVKGGLSHTGSAAAEAPFPPAPCVRRAITLRGPELSVGDLQTALAVLERLCAMDTALYDEARAVLEEAKQRCL